jgi:hypothetical protein
VREALRVGEPDWAVLTGVSDRTAAVGACPKLADGDHRQSCGAHGHAFRIVDTAGNATSVRWSMVPVQPFTPISATQPAQADPN